MSLNRYAKKRDANEPEIVAALEAVGAEVMRLDVVDLLVYFRGALYLLEVKTAKGTLTAVQKKLFPRWPIHVVRDASAALLAIGAIAA